MKRLHITSAHVVAVVALVFTVGTGSAAALKGKNTVDSGDIKQQTIKGADVRDNSLGGADIDESTLVLPAAASKCPAGAPTRSGDVCFSAAQPSAPLVTAVSGCYALGLRIPDPGEAGQLLRALPVGTSTWTGPLADGADGLSVSSLSATQLALSVTPASVTLPYRCVATPTVD
jgi:hypothetical protein